MKDDRYYGDCGYCATGAGGVCLSRTRQLNPFFCIVEFDNVIASEFLSDHNPQVCLTNSDLEMAEFLLQYLVLQKEVEMKFSIASVLSENTYPKWYGRRGWYINPNPTRPDAY